MGAIIAKKNLNQYRCAMSDCNKLLAKGSFGGKIEIRCKCGVDNVLIGDLVLKSDTESRVEERRKSGK